MDDPETSSLARTDPGLFLEQHPPPVILDEIQHVPSLLPTIKQHVDRHRQVPGQFLLTGSQQFPLMQGVTESLAGRAAVLTLLSMSLSERPSVDRFPEALAAAWVRGGFPELVAHPEKDARLWYAGYMQTYLERDVRAIRQVGDLGEFQRFLQAMAARNAQLMNLSEVSRDLGLAVNTMKTWIHVLEASHQMVLVRPYHQNRGKRLIKAPKLYFLETGLLCHLLRLRDPAQALFGPFGGSLLETAVLGEIIRAFVHQGDLPAVYFWRTSAGHEVDFVVETGKHLVPLEVKLAKTLTPVMAKAIEGFCDLFPQAAPHGYVVSLSDRRVPLSRRCQGLPFTQLPKLLRFQGS